MSFFNFNDIIIFSIILLGALLAAVFKKLTVTAAVVGAACAALLYLAAGSISVLMMATFFLLGTGATKWKQHYKQGAGLAEANSGQRTTSQVLANAGTATLLSIILLLLQSQHELFLLMVAGSFSAATADTLSSELGNVYGSRFYNVVSWKPDKKGLDGVVSLEGTVAGLAGSCVIAIMYYLDITSLRHAVIIVLAGLVGNLADSFLGATFERSGSLNNDAVNFLNTAIGALVAGGFFFLWYS